MSGLRTSLLQSQPMQRGSHTLSIVSILVAAFLTGVCSPDYAYAQNPAAPKKEKGWFWYDDPKDLPPPEETPPPPAPVPPPPAAAPKPPAKPEDRPFSVAWIRNKLEVLRDNAIEKPTEENVRAYMYMQRMMVDMSQNFGEAGAKVARNDPMLNEEMRFPFATAQRREALYAVAKAKDNVLADLKGKVGLWFFFDSTCAFCAGQYRTLVSMAKRRGFSLRAISIDGRGLPGMKKFSTDKGKAVFTKLELKLTPAVVMVKPPNDYLLVAHGAMAESDLEDKILLAAVDRDIVPPELKSIVQLEKRGILRPEDVDKIRNGMKDPENPQELVDMVTKAAQGRFQ